MVLSFEGRGADGASFFCLQTIQLLALFSVRSPVSAIILLPGIEGLRKY